MGAAGNIWLQWRGRLRVAAVVVRIDGLGALRDRQGAGDALAIMVGVGRCLSGTLRLSTGVSVDWGAEVAAWVPPRRAGRMARDLARLRRVMAIAPAPGVRLRIAVVVARPAADSAALWSRARAAASSGAGWSLIEAGGISRATLSGEGLAGVLARRMIGAAQPTAPVRAAGNDGPAAAGPTVGAAGQVAGQVERETGAKTGGQIGGQTGGQTGAQTGGQRAGQPQAAAPVPAAPPAPGDAAAGSGCAPLATPPMRRAMAPVHPAVEAHFQPQLCCHTGEATGFEALARLRDPLRGLLSPGQFLPFMDVPALQGLSRAMLQQSLAAVRHWDDAGHAVDTVSINLGGPDLADPWLADDILWSVDRAELRPGRLVIELLESLPPDLAPDIVARNLTRLAAAGCRIDLDDFGTGHSGFEAAHRLGAGRIKIDRSLVARCDRDAERQQAIVEVISTAERLGLKALAEGVETPGEHGLVAQLGCSHVQGFAIARPMPLSETGAFLGQCAERARSLPQLRRA